MAKAELVRGGQRPAISGGLSSDTVGPVTDRAGVRRVGSPGRHKPGRDADGGYFHKDTENNRIKATARMSSV